MLFININVFPYLVILKSIAFIHCGNSSPEFIYGDTPIPNKQIDKINLKIENEKERGN